MRMASSAFSTAASDAAYLAMPASMSQRRPSSQAFAALCQRDRRFRADRHLGELELDRLVLVDRLAEGLRSCA
jgi:hypothetical protein